MAATWKKDIINVWETQCEEEDGDGGDTFGGGAVYARKIISLYDYEIERVQAHDCCFSDIDTRAEYEKSLKQMGLRAKSSARG